MGTSSRVPPAVPDALAVGTPPPRRTSSRSPGFDLEPLVDVSEERANGTSMSAQTLEALFAERSRVARDLHDGVVQSVFAISLSLAVSGSSISTGSRHGSSRLGSGRRLTGTGTSAEKGAQAAGSIAHDRAAIASERRIGKSPERGEGLVVEEGEPFGLPADQLGRQLGVAPLLRQRRRRPVHLEVGEGTLRLRCFGPGVRQPQALHAGTERCD